MVRHVLRLVSLLLGATLAGCATAGGPGTRATTTQAPRTSSGPADCPDPGGPLDLGWFTLDHAPSTYLRAQAGNYLIVATGFQHGGPFDPAVGRTIVSWGAADSPPTYSAGPNTVSGASGTITLVENVPALVHLPAGRLWFLNSAGASLTIRTCSGVAASVIDA